MPVAALLAQSRNQVQLLWSAHYYASEIDNSRALPGLGRHYWYDTDGGIEDSGNTNRPGTGVNLTLGHSSPRCLSQTIGVGTAAAGCRNFFNKWTEDGVALFYRAWVNLPLITLETSPVGFHQIWQKKVREGGSSSYVAWKLNIINPGANRMALQWAWTLGVDAGELGPHEGEDNTAVTYKVDSPVDIPASQWVELTVYQKQSRAFDGRVIVWQDRRKIFDLRGIKTNTPTGSNTWSFNHYGDNLEPNSTTVLWDDVEVIRAPLHAWVY